MQQGRPVADALYYYGDHVPNFVQLKPSDPAKVMPGFDYDVTDEEALLTLRVENGELTLPDGMRYRILVLPDLPVISPTAIKKIRSLVEAGATVLGRKSERATGMQGDAEVRRIADELWGSCSSERRVGKGRIVCSGTGRDLLLRDKIAPDFEFTGAPVEALDYIHRTAGGVEIYFVSNQGEQSLQVPATFRVAGKKPQVWDGVSGEIRTPAFWSATPDGRTRVDLNLPPYASAYVVFGSSATALPPAPAITQQQAIEGPWHVRFTSRAKSPAAQDFPTLKSWTESPDPDLQYFSGTAIYSTTIDAPAAAAASKRILLDLGTVGEVAEVFLNVKSIGTYWDPPMQADLTASLKPGANQLEIRVTNLWINRLKGDAQLPVAERTTRTNITQLPKGPLMASGLMGPVVLRWAGK